MDDLNGQPLKRKSLLQMRYPSRKGGARCNIDLVAAGLVKDPVLTEKNTINEGKDDMPRSRGQSLLQLRQPRRKGGVRCGIDMEAVGLFNHHPVPKKELDPKEEQEEWQRQFFSLYNLRKLQEKRNRRGGALCQIDLVAAGIIKDPLSGVKDNNVAEEGKINPLTMPEVLEHVLSFVEDVEDLKSVRCVSKMWMEESLDKWRNTAVFRLDAASEPTLKLTLNIRDELEPEKSQQDLQPWQFDTWKKPQPLPPSPPPTAVLHRFEEKPFKRYNVKVGPLLPPELPCRRNELYFWEKCGQFVHYLRVKLRTYDGALRWIVGEVCPNVWKEGLIMDWINVPETFILDGFRAGDGLVGVNIDGRESTRVEQGMNISIRMINRKYYRGIIA